MNEKDIKDAIKQRIADKIQDACDGENIADAIMSNEQNQDFIDTNDDYVYNCMVEVWIYYKLV